MATNILLSKRRKATNFTVTDTEEAPPIFLEPPPKSQKPPISQVPPSPSQKATPAKEKGNGPASTAEPEAAPPQKSAWELYNERATPYDKEMLGEWEETLNNLLVFVSVHNIAGWSWQETDTPAFA
jgi:hypothetical protein